MCSSETAVYPNQNWDMFWLQGQPRTTQHLESMCVLATPFWSRPAASVIFGVLLDNDLSMRSHVSRVASTCSFHLFWLCRLGHILDTDLHKQLVSALVFSELAILIPLANLPTWHICCYNQCHSPFRGVTRAPRPCAFRAEVTSLAANMPAHWL